MNLSDQKYLIISVIGPHAGEDLSVIFYNKQKELEINNLTYWLIKSFRAKTLVIQNMCKAAEIEGTCVYCVFIDASSKNAAKSTKNNSLAKSISNNGIDWHHINLGSTITGKLDKHSTALVLDKLIIADPALPLDLWEYSEFSSGDPVKIQQGASTICCEKIPSEFMKSRFRNVIAWGKLKSPYAVYVR